MKKSMLILLIASSIAGASDKSFDVRAHGAKADRKTNDQAAFQAAVDACSKAGGGKVIVPAGDYLCGGLQLSSGVTFHI